MQYDNKDWMIWDLIWPIDPDKEKESLDPIQPDREKPDYEFPEPTSEKTDYLEPQDLEPHDN